MASDSRVAFGSFSSDRGALKNIPIGHYYAVLLAGNDVVYAMPTIKRVRKAMSDDMTDPDEIAMLLHDELAATLRQKIESRILRKIGMTMELFLTSGKESLTESVYYDIFSEIRREEMSLTFLLAGFDSSGTAHIRVVTSDDAPQDYDLLGFAAIGSGALNALASLSFAKDYNSLSESNDIHEVTYHVLVAKFMAESATDVGKDTFYVCIGPSGICHFLNPFAGGVDPIRKEWEQSGAPRTSVETLEVIKAIGYHSPDKADSLEMLERVKVHASPVNRSIIEKKISMLKQSALSMSKDQK